MNKKPESDPFAKTTIMPPRVTKTETVETVSVNKIESSPEGIKLLQDINASLLESNLAVLSAKEIKVRYLDAHGEIINAIKKGLLREEDAASTQQNIEKYLTELPQK